MTNPGVLRIFSDAHDGVFYAHWAAPERVVPALARWTEWCVENQEMPTASSYFEYALSTDGEHFHSGLAVDEPDPFGIDYRYEVSSTATGDGWSAELSIWRRDPAASDQQMTPWHHVTYKLGDTGPIHELAMYGIRQIIANVESLDRPHLTAEALAEWAELEAWHRTRSGVAA
jgi:hypothetical protein